MLNTLYTYNMNVGCTPRARGFGASSMTPQSHSGSTEGNMGKYLGLGKRKYHVLMIRDFIIKGNTPKTVTFDVGEYDVSSFVGGRRAAIVKKDQIC
jgi:hypothetical protein